MTAQLLDTTEDHFVSCDTPTLLRQIGTMNVMAISGLRVHHRETGVSLPVSDGYSVTVDMAPGDTYTVRRVLRRGAKVFLKGEMTGIYAENLASVAYKASCFNNGEFGE